MLGTLQKWVADNLGAVEREPQLQGRGDVELAMAALLVELARADFKEDPREFSVIRELLARYLQSPEHVDQLLQKAAVRADRAVSLHEFTRQLNVEASDEQKLDLVEMLWRVSLSDGRIDPHEGHLVRKVAGLLHVRERDLVRLRLKVQSGP